MIENKSSFYVVVKIADHVQHAGWISREEIFDSFNIECSEEDTIRVAHDTMRKRDPKSSEHTLTFTVTKII